MRWNRTVVVGRIDPRVVAPALAATIERLRMLRVVDGVVLDPDDGHPVPGVRIAVGSWPHPGAAFTITPRPLTDVEIAARVERIREMSPTAPITEAQMRAALDRRDDLHGELVADGRDRSEVSWTVQGARHHLVVDAPGAPTRITSTIVATGGNSCLTRGEVTTDARIDVAAIATRAASRPVVTIDVRHRRFVVRCRIDAAFATSGTTLTFDARARGAGMVRPLAAVFGFLLSGMASRALDTALAEWQRDGSPPLGPFVARTDPRAIASALVHELLSL